MSNKPPQTIAASNLSHAWGRAFLHVMDNSLRNLTPLTLSIDGFTNCLPAEDDAIRQALDARLSARPEKHPTKVSALTIFPYDAWVRRDHPGVAEFSDWYLTEFFPRLKKRNSLNSHGTYFERMVRFQGTKADHGTLQPSTKNQLAHIVEIWRRDGEKGRRPRRSALQIAVFDPPKDHTGGALLGFPCLQQVSLSYDEDSSALAISAYYPTQYIMDRAYGNYLGLCHLGYFMAREMGLELTRLNCFIGLPELGRDWTKSDLQPLAQLVRERLPHAAEGADAHGE